MTVSWNIEEMKKRDMRKRLCATIALLFFLAPCMAANIATLQNDNQQKSANPLQLAEADKLSAQVVKLYNEDKFAEALPIAKRVLEIRESVLGGDHTAVADALNNLAAVYLGQGNNREAESLLKRSLVIYEKAEGTENPKLCFILEKLAWIRLANNDYGKAEDLLKRSLAIKEKIFGEKSRETAQSLLFLAQFYQHEDKRNKAISFYQRAIAIAEAVAGNSNKEIAEMYDNCACLMMLEKQEEAKQYDAHAVSLYQKTDPANVKRMTNPEFSLNATVRQEPVYPPEVLLAGISGSVTIEVLVDETGTVIDTRPVCGTKNFIVSSEKAARGWKFKPVLVKGKPIKAIGKITFNYKV